MMKLTSYTIAFLLTVFYVSFPVESLSATENSRSDDMAVTKSPPVPKGWFVAGDQPKSYDMGLCTDVFHTGTGCGRISSTEKKIDGFGTLMQMFHAGGYQGKRVKLSAYIKTEKVKDWSGLWMRIDEGKEIVGFDNMQDRPINGDTDWTKYEVVLDIPEKSTNVALGVLLSGTGTVWFDDCAFETVSKTVKTTGDLNRSCGIRYQNDEPTNLDFSRGLRPENDDLSISATPVGWFMQSKAGSEVSIGLEKAKRKGAAASAFIKSARGSSGALLQALLADKYVGKRLKLTAQVKTDDVTGGAALFFRTDAGRKLMVTYDYMQDRLVSGSNDWTECTCVIDIPQGSDNIYFGGTLEGNGSAWFKNFKLEEVSQDVATTGKNGKENPIGRSKAKTAVKKPVNALPENLNFEKKEGGIKCGVNTMPVGWVASGSHPDKFKMCVDSETTLEGANCALIEAQSGAQKGFGTFMQMVDADFCRGKRMRLSARIKTEEADWAALWMRIDGEDGEVLGFDNMQKNPIKDTTDWNYYECVLDVPDKSKNIAFGVLLSGKGKVWFSKVAVDEVSGAVESTDIKEILSEHQGPQNLRFEEG